jgi:ABC-2 type transport system permease protein
MRELLLLLNIKAHSFLKNVFEWKWQTIVKNVSSLMIFGGFAVGVFFLARIATFYLLHEAHIGQFLFHRFLSMLLYVFFITINLGNMIVSYATLYRSQEVNFLMGLPIDHAKIFLLKFVDNFFYSSTTLSLIGFAVLLGYGSVYDLPWYHSLFVLFFILLPFMLIAGIIAVITLMLLMKAAFRIGVRRLLAIIGTLYVMAIYAYFKIVSPVELVSQVMKHYPDVNEYFGYLDPPLVRYLPSHWVSEYLYWSSNGEPSRAIPYFTLLFLTMLALIVAAGLMARRYYYTSWLAASDKQSTKGERRRRILFRSLEFGHRSFLSSQTEVVLKRDVWLFLREPSQWLHLLLMLLLLLIFLISMSTFELKLTQPFLQAVTFLVVFLFNGFLIASVSLRFVFPAVSLESESFWCVRSSPLSMKKLYWHKFLFALALVMVVAELLSVASLSMLVHDTSLVIFGALCTGLIALALTSLNLGAGTYFALFKEKNPIRVASSQGASLTFLASMIYLTVIVGAMVVPLNKYFESMILFRAPAQQWLYMPTNVVAVLSLVLFALSTNVGLRSIKGDVKNI